MTACLGRQGAVSVRTHPALLWDVLLALHLHKRPQRARAALAATLVAAQARGYPVHFFVPQASGTAAAVSGGASGGGEGRGRASRKGDGREEGAPASCAGACHGCTVHTVLANDAYWGGGGGG